MTPANILLKCIAKINELYNVDHMTTPEETETNDNESNDGTSNDGTSNDRSSLTEPIVVDPDIERAANNEANVYEPLFQKILDFLFVYLIEPSALHNVGLKICTKALAERRSDRQHTQLT